MNLKQHFESKTNGPFLLFLLVIVGLSLMGKLSQETVDALKWLGISFFSVRGVSNFTEVKVEKP